MIKLPEQFLERCSKFIPASQFSTFVDSFELPTSVSVRYNPQKGGNSSDLEQVGWCEKGFYLKERPKFTIDPLFHAGLYYVQESSSMFLEQTFKAATKFIGCNNLSVLDLCAAPGGKSTHLASLVGENSLVVANEVIKSRARILEENIIKWGSGNVVVTNNDPSHFDKLGSFFDLALIDAPCSGEGMFRKDHNAREEWSVEGVELCAARSKRIIGDVWNSIREDGVLIYSTCTFNLEENEQMLDWISQNYNVEPIDVEVDPSWGVTTVVSHSGFKGYKFLPHKSKGEGLFMAAMVKRESSPKLKISKKEKTPFELASKNELQHLKKWVRNSDNYSFIKRDENMYAIESSLLNNLALLYNRLNIYTFGIELGKLFGKDLKPSHNLATATLLNRECVSSVDVSLEDALQYLRKNDIEPSQFEQGINLVTYKSQPIGFIKRVGARCNNLYPKQLRILNL